MDSTSSTDPQRDCDGRIVQDEELRKLADAMEAAAHATMPFVLSPANQACNHDRSIVESLRLGGFLRDEADLAAASTIVAGESRFLVEALSLKQKALKETILALARSLRREAFLRPSVDFSVAHIERSTAEWKSITDIMDLRKLPPDADE